MYARQWSYQKSVSLFKSFFDKKFARLEQKLGKVSEVGNTEKDIEFKYKGNKAQYKFNCNVLTKMKSALAQTEDGYCPG